jgi:hypothetical protein
MSLRKLRLNAAYVPSVAGEGFGTGAGSGAATEAGGVVGCGIVE